MVIDALVGMDALVVIIDLMLIYALMGTCAVMVIDALILVLGNPRQGSGCLVGAAPL